MPALFIFLIKVNVALLVFCAGYYLVLRHLTFYTLNRVYLITAIAFSTIYPKIDLTAFAERHENIAVPVQTVILKWRAPAVKLITPLAHPDYWQWATLLFWTGVVLLTVRFTVQLVSLIKLHRNSHAANVMDHDVRLMSGDAAPFSFWRSIYVNPANHTPADLRSILLHEQVHVNGWHTLDILLAELSSIFYWFNPGVWLMKKAIRENIEFITDRKILNKGVDTRAYQYSLVNVSFNTTTPGIVNHFNISTIKKRIIMMNAKRSSRVNLTRYAFILPAIALLMVFSFSKAAIVKTSRKAVKDITYKLKADIKEVIPQELVVGVTFNKTTNTPNKIAPTNTNKNAVGVLIASKRDDLLPALAGPVNLQLGRADTNSKSLFFATTLLKKGDTLTYILNGKKISAAEFNKTDPEKIISINITDAASAKRMLNDYPSLGLKDEGKVLFVTTKDSPEGKKITDLLGTKRQITHITVNRNGDILTQDFKQIPADTFVTVTGSLSPLASTVYRSSKEPGDVIVRGYGSKKGALASTGDNLVYKEVVVSGKPSKALTYSSVGAPGAAKVYTTRPGADLAEVRSINRSLTFTTGSVNRISDKLIVIDGKEASENDLKKLTAFDIDRMNVSSDADTVKKYGEKAKYGVVYIYTKKGSKK
ncbi:M56 family peptidase [Mucilaginibacter terrenus]|uniref:M56 family peptidase n=1 Tax=Mucilaginibacter terrenus TaxID=2482727 RepID=A0A3E2NTN4_9SPHI|nr:M56 family metallopeptidase [Mucilaginibacter terrenus]RFZ84375.1 M56 family peptidase [Mucilaginibacter terrenus]